MSTVRLDEPHGHQPRIYLECHETATNRLKTGIQRVVRNLILNHSTAAQSLQISASPARFFGDSFYPFEWQPDTDSQDSFWGESLSRRFTSLCGEMIAERWIPRINVVAGRARKAVRFRKLRRLCQSLWLRGFGTPLRPAPGDTMVLADATWGLPIWNAVRQWREQGGKVAFVVYDILAITHSQFFRASLSQRFSEWFEQVLENSDLLLAISDTVRDQLRDLIRQRHLETHAAYPRVESFRLGAELDMQHADASIRSSIRAHLSPAAGPAPYLMVGTIEPRKNHHTVLDAFEQLWEQGRDVRLCVVGRRGWECQNLERRMLEHRQYGRNLLWVPDMTDSELQHCYQRTRGVLFASHGEGFGLPIIEGLQAGKPVIASDLPVHREVAGDFAAYFDPSRPDELAAWIERLETFGFLPGIAPASDFHAVTWLEGTTELLRSCRDAFTPRAAVGMGERSKVSASGGT